MGTMINASRNYRLFKIAHTTPALSVQLPATHSPHVNQSFASRHVDDELGQLVGIAGAFAFEGAADQLLEDGGPRGRGDLALDP
jgi:hypothetical protein